MGSFPGHAIPGSFFVMFSLWWISQVARRRMMCDQKKISYFNTATFPVPLGNLSKYPAEGVAKMIASVVGMSCELFASLGYGSGKLESIGDIEHFTMYSFFMLSGLVDCFVYRGSKTFPPGMDYFTLTLAFMAEWVLFRHHLDGRSALDVEVHTCLLYVISACVVMTLVEFKYHESELATWMRCYVTFLQGTWFYQIGIILYPPHPSLHHWEDDNKDQLMLAAIIFAWHCFVDIVVIAVLYLLARCCYTRHCRLFDFRVEHQLLAQGWSLKSLRSKRKRHKGNMYRQIDDDEWNNTLVPSEEEINETEIT